MSKVEYKNTLIKDIGRVVTGKTPETKKAEFYGNGYMFITPAELHDGYNVQVSDKYITESGLQSIKSNCIDGTSVMVGCIGWDMGNVAICHRKCATNQQINSITDFNPKYNPFYTYYWLLTKKDYLFTIASVTRTPILSKSTFEEIVIPMPDRSIQDNVVETLKPIDDMMENNKRICSELEAMAKTLYDYWFVQFDFPDENGNPYRSSGGEMVWNEQLKREIPKGWEAKNIQEVCAIVDCLHSKKPDLSFESENYYLLQLDNLVDMGLLDLSNKYYVSANDYAAWTSKIEVRCGDLVITNAGRVGDIARIPEEIICGIGRNMTAIRAVNVDPIFMYYFFASSDMKAQVKSNTDTGSFFGSLNVRGIKQLIMPIPSEKSEIMNRFIDIVRPIRENLEMVAQQSQELSKLRDWLLPMLMNGQARME